MHLSFGGAIDTDVPGGNPTVERVATNAAGASSGTMGERKEVVLVATVNDQPNDDFVPTEELARRQGVTPIASVDELAQPDLWESEGEYEEFLADLYASRRAGLA